MSEADKKIAVLEAEIDTLKKKLKLANELNLKLFEDYKKAQEEKKKAATETTKVTTKATAATAKPNA